MRGVRVLSARVAGLLAVRSERGVTALEYGLIVALLVLAIVAAVTLLGNTMSTTFNTIANKVSTP